MKMCPRCVTTKDDSEFSVNKKRRDGLNSWCKKCNNEYHQINKVERLAIKSKDYYSNVEKYKERGRRQHKRHVEKHMLGAARSRAKKRNLPCNITIDDIVIPEFCPVLGIPLQVGTGKSTPNSPSLDRIIPEKGYVKGNVIVVSMKANQIKNCATVEEIEAVFNFYKKLLENSI